MKQLLEPRNNILHKSLKLDNIRELMMFLLLIIVVKDHCYMAMDCSLNVVFVICADVSGSKWHLKVDKSN